MKQCKEFSGAKLIIIDRKEMQLPKIEEENSEYYEEVKFPAKMDKPARVNSR